MSDNKPEQVIVDLTIAAPIETVWSALREPHLIKTWFGWETPSLDEEIEFIFVTHATGDEARRVIQFGEWEGSSDRIELDTVVGGTRLRMLRSGGEPVDWTGVYEDISQGWINFFQQLRFALELHPDAERRTIYLSGSSKEGVGEPSAGLGLSHATALADGAAYQATLSTGDDISGTVWYQTHFQTALTADTWGPGLLVVTDMGVSPRRPHGGGSVLLTTYGLSEAAFGDLDARWRAWWEARYFKPAS